MVPARSFHALCSSATMRLLEQSYHLSPCPVMRDHFLLHVPHFAKASLEVDIDETCREAKQQGIGVIIAEKPDSYDTWDEQVEAVRREPDPARLNDFLAQQVSLEFREHVIRWLK